LSLSPANNATETAPTNGWWFGGQWIPDGQPEALAAALLQLNKPVHVVDAGQQQVGISQDGAILCGQIQQSPDGALPLLATVPPLTPSQLGDPEFQRDHGVRFNYVAGEMANGIGSADIVEAMGQNGMLGFFGSAGLSLERVRQAIERIQKTLGDLPYGFNLIHSPNEPKLEAALVEMYLAYKIRLVSAAAFLGMTLPLVRYRVAGLAREASGRITILNKLIAKVSRVEVARKFLSPPPPEMVQELLRLGLITPDQAELAKHVPMCDDLTAEADSGGHTDNRPALALLPTMLALRDELQTLYDHRIRLRIGLGGGIATPSAAAAAFAMGAAYILTGSINQACAESGTSQVVREMLAQAGQADVTMAPAADMFEMGVKVQVLKWGTMFPVRAQKLYSLYRDYDGLHALPPAEKNRLERDFLRMSVDEAWQQTKDFFAQRDPGQITRADQDPKHQMALVFRSYLGQTSKWAIQGVPDRKQDYQVWCGPAMGAFNEWVKGSWLEPVENRSVVPVAQNLMIGACALTRASYLRSQGLDILPEAARFQPLRPPALAALML
jgi:PfaD family protein